MGGLSRQRSVRQRPGQERHFARGRCEGGHLIEAQLDLPGREAVMALGAVVVATPQLQRAEQAGKCFRSFRDQASVVRPLGADAASSLITVPFTRS